MLLIYKDGGGPERVNGYVMNSSSLLYLFMRLKGLVWMISSSKWSFYEKIDKMRLNLEIEFSVKNGSGLVRFLNHLITFWNRHPEES